MFSPGSDVDLGFHLITQERHYIVDRNFLLYRASTVLVFDRTFVQTPVSDDNSVWNSDQLCIGKHDTGANLPVVEQHLQISGLELAVEIIHRLLESHGLVHVHRQQHHMEGSNCTWPDDPALVVVLLYGGGYDSSNPDPVTTHRHRRRFTIFVQTHGLQRFAVLGPELKYVTDLDTTGD